MPLTWVEPELLMEYKGVYIYHTYKDNFLDSPSTYWYTTAENEDDGFEFDIRSLHTWKSSANDYGLGHLEDVKKAIRDYIDEGFEL